MSVVPFLNHHLGRTISNHTQMLKQSVLIYSQEWGGGGGEKVRNYAKDKIPRVLQNVMINNEIMSTIPLFILCL